MSTKDLMTFLGIVQIQKNTFFWDLPRRDLFTCRIKTFTLSPPPRLSGWHTTDRTRVEKCALWKPLPGHRSRQCLHPTYGVLRAGFFKFSVHRYPRTIYGFARVPPKGYLIQGHHIFTAQKEDRFFESHRVRRSPNFYLFFALPISAAG